MKRGSRFLFCLICVLSFFSLFSCESGVIKIAFIVKDINESWFQQEIEYAKMASSDFGFELLVYPDDSFDRSQIYTTEMVLKDIEKAKDAGAKGVVVCAPDVSRGDEIVALCNKLDLKLMSVDDRFKDFNSWSGYNENVSHLGIDSYAIGRLVGISLAREISSRGWNLNSVGVIELYNKSTPDIMERVEGAVLMLQEVLAFNESNFFVFDSPESTLESYYNLVMRRFPAISYRYTRWIVVGMNDDCVIGGLRALNALGISKNNILCFGINGSTLAQEELVKGKLGLLGSVKLQAAVHGYDSVKYMYRWIFNQREPEKMIVTNGILITPEDVKIE